MGVCNFKLRLFKYEFFVVEVRITAVLDFVHRSVCWRLEDRTFRKLDLFLSSVDGKMHMLC
jgi:hypothetical protein